MRFLGIGKDASLGDMYLSLLREGHEVRTYVESPEWRCILRGMINLTESWQRELDWIREADGIVLFERADCGDLQDRLRSEGFNVIGGSAFGDRMERDRAFGQACMRTAGIKTAPSQAFADFRSALELSFQITGGTRATAAAAGILPFL